MTQLREDHRSAQARARDESRRSDEWLVLSDDDQGVLYGPGSRRVVFNVARRVEATDSARLRSMFSTFRQFFLWSADVRATIYASIGDYERRVRELADRLMQLRPFETPPPEIDAEREEMSLSSRWVLSYAQGQPVVSAAEITNMIALRLYRGGRLTDEDYFSYRSWRETAGEFLQYTRSDPGVDERTLYMIECLRDAMRENEEDFVNRMGEMEVARRELEAVNAVAEFTRQRIRGLQANTVIADDHQVLANVLTDNERSILLNAFQPHPSIAAGTPLIYDEDGYLRPCRDGETASAVALGEPDEDGTIRASCQGHIVSQTPPRPGPEPEPERLLTAVYNGVDQWHFASSEGDHYTGSSAVTGPAVTTNQRSRADLRTTLKETLNTIVDQDTENDFYASKADRTRARFVVAMEAAAKAFTFYNSDIFLRHITGGPDKSGILVEFTIMADGSSIRMSVGDISTDRVDDLPDTDTTRAIDL